jgi:hypothetical protein
MGLNSAESGCREKVNLSGEIGKAFNRSLLDVARSTASFMSNSRIGVPSCSQIHDGPSFVECAAF